LLTGEATPSVPESTIGPVASAPSGWRDSKVTVDHLAREIVPLVDREIAAAIQRDVGDEWMRGAIGYQFGWADTDFRALAPDRRQASGKRLRPLMAMLAYRAASGTGAASDKAARSVANAVSFAAAVELIHNFSLIHDDIEDGDRVRRGRPTLWAICGEAQAINIGDCVQALAFACLGRLGQNGVDAELLGELVCALAKATVATTIGQRRDMSYERTDEVDAGMYAEMIAGKTAALMSCATFGGALLAAGGDPLGGRERARAYADFGRELGLCFQVRDDILGIWGAETATGKASGGDIRRRKKSLPIVLALATATGTARGRLAELYALHTELDAGQEHEVREILEAAAAQARCQRQAEIHAARALEALARAEVTVASPFVATLRSLTGSLTARSG
jgi:geranylgeranyl diphosphate synthase type I